MREESVPYREMEPENELIAQRREKLEALRKRGVDPFGAAFENSGSIAEVRRRFKESELLRVAGRTAGRHRPDANLFARKRDRR